MNWRTKHWVSARKFRRNSQSYCLEFAQLEPRQLLATVNIIAAGVQGQEQVSLQIDQQTVQTWNNLGGDANQDNFVTLSYSNNSEVTPDQVRVVFENDLYDPVNGIDRSVRIDAIVIDGERFETEASNVYSTGTWKPEDGVAPGFRASEYLHENGYFQFSSVSQGPGTTITVRASGNEGGEQFELRIGGQTVASLTATNSFQTYTYQAAATVTASQLQVAFTNDLYDPQSGIDYNLNVDFVSLDGVVYETESPNVFSTGTFKEIDGLAPGFRQSETLHFNGYFAYEQPLHPGVISLESSVINVAETDGAAKFTIVRSDGADGIVTVDYRTVALSATSGQDFVSNTGTVVFLDGERSKTISVLLVDDNEVETDEQFSFTIDNVVGAELLVPRTAIATIDDNDSILSSGNGLLGEYFDGPGFSDPFQSRVDPWVHYTWSVFPPISGMGTDNFSVRWTGQIEPLYTETYTFWTLSDDGMRVWVDNELVIDQWDAHELTLHAGRISLNAGERHDIRVEYYQRTGDAVAKLFWGSPSQQLQAVPQSQLYAASAPELASDELQTETVATGLTEPTAIDFTSDGSLMYIAEKGGIVKVVQNGNLSSVPFLDFSDKVNGVRDRGLLDVAVHPNFEIFPFVYLLYTYDPPEVNQYGGLAGPDGLGNRAGRLTRLTADVNNDYLTMVPGSEFVLIGGNSTWDNFNGFVNSTNNFNEPPAGILPDGSNLRDFINSDSESHSVGSIDFAPDGALIVSTGDGASFNQVDPRAVRVQDIDNLSGKVLRVNPITGKGLPDNPFFVEGDADANRSKVYQYGLRNPFRVHVNPDTGQVYVGDVGWSAWEEINSAEPGANFGWPFYEGGNGVSLQTASYQDLPEAQAFYASNEQVTPSIYGLNHAVAGVNAILLGDFYTGSAYPAEYQDDLFFNDLGQGVVRNISFDQAGNITSVDTFTTGAFVVVDIVQGPDGYMYFVDLDDGTVGYWKFAESGRAFATGARSVGAPVTTKSTTIGDASGVTIAVIDSGVDLNHSQLAGSFWINEGEIAGDGIDNDLNGYIDDVSGFDFADQDEVPFDFNGQGTFLAGAIAGLDVGLVSGAKIMPLRVLDENGVGRWDAIAEAIRYAVDNDAHIINLAMEIDGPSRFVENQIRYASENDVLVVIAANDDPASDPNWLADLSERFENVIVAGAIGNDGGRIAVVDSGLVQIDAPSTAFGLLLGGGSTTYRGTSVATTYVTSVAAVALKINPDLTAKQLRDLLVSSSSIDAGAGFAPMLDVVNALNVANQSAEFVFNVVDDRLLIRTSRFDDDVRFDLGQSEILINGIRYEIEPGYSQVSIHGKAGYDTLSFGDSMEDDDAFVVTNFAQFDSPTQLAIGMDFEKVQFRAANGDDSIWTAGSSGADQVTMEGATFSLAGPEYFRGGTGFDNVRVVGGDGVDRVNLTGTAITEEFFSAPNLVRLTHDELFTQFVGMEIVIANLGEGSDSSIMLGGATSDTLILAPNSARLIGGGFDYQVLDAEITTSYGGDDEDSTTIQDGNGNEVLNLRPRRSFVQGEGFQHWAYGFESTEAESTAGDDRATVYGTDGNDTFTGGPATSRFQGEGFDARLTGFSTILLFGNGGDDQSQYVAGPGPTNFLFSTQLSQVTGPGMVITTIGFNQFFFDGGSGESNVRLVADMGEDRLTVANVETVLDNEDYEIRLMRIDELFAVAAPDASDDIIEFLDNPNELEFEFNYSGDWFVI